MSLRRLVLPFLVCLAVSVALAPPAGAATAPHAREAQARCVAVDATGVGQDLGGGRTTATISVGGVEVGTTQAAFTITGSVGSQVSFAGPITFTSRRGTLVAEVTGTLDAATGVFTSTSTSLSGTGFFRHVTGDLTLTGTEDLSTGTFTESITGRLCRGTGH